MSNLHFEVYDFLEKKQREQLAEYGDFLHRVRGSRQAVRTICEIIAGQQPRMAEKEGRLDLLFDKPVKEITEKQLLRVLRDFVPIWTQVHVVDLSRQCAMDSYVMLDDNAVLIRDGSALDCAARLGHAAIN